MIQPVQAAIQHFDQDISQLRNEHRAERYICKSVDVSSIAQIIDKKFRQASFTAQGPAVEIDTRHDLRSRITAPFGTPREELEARAMADEKVRPFVEGKQVVKIVAVLDKLINIVVR